MVTVAEQLPGGGPHGRVEQPPDGGPHGRVEQPPPGGSHGRVEQLPGGGPHGRVDPIGALPAGRSRAQLVTEVARVLRVLDEGEVVVVAASGGPDSTALAALAEEARPDLDLMLVHVRHGLRDDAEDVATVTRLADLLGLRLRIEQVDIRLDGRGVEDAARRSRHAALDRVATTQRAARILTGHTADDQAETVLLRVARGTGLHGLAAMAVDTGRLLRPLLRLRRADVHAFVAGEGLPSVTDPMNDDTAIRRVRARQEVLPALERLGPDPVGALARLAGLAAADEEALDEVARRAVADHVVAVGTCWCVASDALDVLGAAIARRLVRHLLTVSGADDEYGPPADHVQAALSLRDGALLDLGSVRVSVGGGWLAVGPVRAPDPAESVLAVPGRTAWPLIGADLVAELDEAAPQLPIEIDLAPPRARERLALLPGAHPDRLSLRLPPTHDELIVRTPRPGDRIRTDGGTRKLQDVLVDAGVPRVLRPMLPVVVAGERLAWVPGLAADRDLLRGGRRSSGTLLHLVGRRHTRPRRSPSLMSTATR